MKLRKAGIGLVGAAFAALLLAACQPGAGEKAGEKLDTAVEQAGGEKSAGDGAMENAGEKVDEALKDAGDAADKAADKAGQAIEKAADKAVDKAGQAADKAKAAVEGQK